MVTVELSEGEPIEFRGPVARLVEPGSGNSASTLNRVQLVSAPSGKSLDVILNNAHSLEARTAFFPSSPSLATDPIPILSCPGYSDPCIVTS